MENHKKMENTGEQTHKRHNTNPSLVPKRHQRNGGKEIIKEISDFPKTEQPIFRLKGPGKYLAHWMKKDPYLAISSGNYQKKE